MNKLFAIKIIFFCVLFILNCSSTQTYKEALDINTLSALKQYFSNPPVQYQTVPFWVWHDKVSKKEIDIQLQDFKTKGIGGVFIHPRYGLITEYLSDEWFELVQYAVNQAKSLGMHAWLYDENSFPSGFAGGHVPAEMPESYNQGQGLVLHKMSSLPEDAADKYHLILKRDGEDFVEIKEVDSEMGEGGNYYLFELVHYGKSKWYGGFSYVDLLVDGVTEKFIELTMQGYEQTIGTEFGKSVPGIFTDEPNIRPPRGKDCMRYTPVLFSKFKQRWDYDLRTKLPALFEEVGDWKRVRHNYYSLLLEMFIERWSKPWYRYCEDNNLRWTGHYWEHGWPNPQHGSDNMAMYAWHQIPGIDMLFNNLKDRPDQFGNIRAVKELRSVANQLGRKRTLSETYGAAGWELSFRDMKRLGDWEYVLGVNFMNQHLSYMTLIGDRKHDFPQSFSYHAPWWDFYKPLADYFSRLSVALSSGDQLNTILVMEPTTTTWMYSSWKESPQRLWDIGDMFHDLLDKLEMSHIEYDLGCENIIKDHGKVEGGKFIVGERAYEIVVLPEGMENLDRFTFQLLEQYLNQGGTVISFEETPEYVDGEESPELRALFEQFKDHWIRVKSTQDSPVKDLLFADDFRVHNPEEIGGKLFHQRRQFNDGQLLFWTNMSLQENAIGKFTIKGKSVVQLNPLNGKITPYPFELQDDQLEIDFDLPPAGSLMLFVSTKKSSQAPAAIRESKDQVLQPTGNIQIQRIAPNALTLDYCDLKLGDEVEHGIYFYTAGNKIWQHHGFEDNPWVSSAQYKTNILDRDNFAEDSGFEVRYFFDVDSAVEKSSLRAVIERPQLWDVSINDSVIKPLEDQWWLDRAWAVFDISQHIKHGSNSIKLATHPMSIHAELEPIYIIGDFRLKSRPHGWKIFPDSPLALGEWREQGLPFYSYGISYTRNYTINKTDKQYVVELGDWKGTVTVVKINGAFAGMIGWQPYELDVTDLISNGENQVEIVVYGSLKNLLGPHHNVTRRGIVTPWSFKYAPEQQPAGLDYDLDGYGLFDEFQLMERR